MGSRFQYQIGDDFRVDPANAAFFRAGREVHVRYKTFQVLLYLLDRRGQLVTHDDLCSSIWRGTAVSDETIAQSLVELRRLFRDTARTPRFIKTIPHGGYLFVGPVAVSTPRGFDPAPAAAGPAPSAAAVHRWWDAVPALIVLLGFK